jgi:hypothetical protein
LCNPAKCARLSGWRATHKHVLVGVGCLGRIQCSARVKESNARDRKQHSARVDVVRRSGTTDDGGKARVPRRVANSVCIRLARLEVYQYKTSSKKIQAIDTSPCKVSVNFKLVLVRPSSRRHREGCGAASAKPDLGLCKIAESSSLDENRQRGTRKATRIPNSVILDPSRSSRVLLPCLGSVVHVWGFCSDCLSGAAGVRTAG